MKALSPVTFYDQVLDETLIKQYINGDNDALTEIFIRHSSRMKSIAYRITRNPQDADDVVQNSLISIMKNAHKFRGDSKLTTWIYRIVSNAAIDKIRSTKNQKSIDFINDFSNSTNEILQKDLSIDLINALKTLPKNQQSVIYLIDIEGFSISDAAKKLRCAPGTIKSRCHRAHLKLAKQLRIQN